MAQVPNLLDLFQNGRKDAQAPAKPVTDAKPAKGRNAGNLLPIDPAGPSQGNKTVTPAHASFQAKVEKSRAKLAAQDKKPGSPSHTAPKAEAPKKEAPVARAQPARKAEPARPERPAARPQARPDHDDQPTAQAPAAKSDDARTAQATDARTGDQDSALDEKQTAALKKGLKALGIDVDDEQLNDPAFLADLMRMLQAAPTQSLPQDDESDQDAASPVDATQAEAQADAPAAAAPQVQEQPEQDGPIAQAPAQADAKPVTRKELAQLLQGRIDGLMKAAQKQDAGIRVTAQNPAVTPKEWQGIQVRARAEGPSPAPLPMADLDRLRVMQASAAQNANVQGEKAKTGGGFAIETDNTEPVAEVSNAAPAEAGKDASAAEDQDAQADLSGRNGDQTNAADASARKEGPMVAKDGATGPQFQQTLEQVRAGDHRVELPRGAEPRPLRDSAVLDQIAKKMGAVAHKSGDEISIQLTPEHLGKVRVSLEMKEDGMNARIAVANDDVRQQVEANLDSLKDALKDQGIKLQGLEVSVDQRHASLFNPDGSSSESFFHRNGRGGGAGEAGRAGEASSFESAPEADTGRRWGYNTMEYIG